MYANWNVAQDNESQRCGAAAERFVFWFDFVFEQLKSVKILVVKVKH